MFVKHYNLKILVKPAPDLAGQWIGHELEHDIVSQGNSAEHALHMVQEATAMVLAMDLVTAREADRHRAPDEFWSEFRAIVGTGDRVVTLSDAELTGDTVAVIADMSMVVQVLVEGPGLRTPRRAPTKRRETPEFQVQGSWRGHSLQATV